MKNFFKKTLAFVMLFAMAAMCFVGCGEKKSDNELVIGVSGPLTGGASLYGNAVKNGMQIAVDEINAAGGVNGFTLKLVCEDDENTAEKAVSAYRTLKDAGMDVFLGAVTSGCTTAILPETIADNMFLLTPSGSDVDCINGANAFRVCFNDLAQGSASAQYIADNNLAKKVAVIYDSSTTYSTGIYQSFKAKAKELGKFEVFDTNTSFVDGASNFDAQLQSVKASGADLVFLPIYYENAALIIRAAQNILGDSVKFFGCDGLDGIVAQFSDKKGVTADAEMINGVMLLTPYVADAKDSISQKFTAKYEEKYGETPIQFAADGYDAVYAVVAAVKQAGVKPEDRLKASQLCEKLKVAMTQIKVDGATGLGMTWNDKGEPEKEPKAMYIDVTKDENGVYSAVYKATE